MSFASLLSGYAKSKSEPPAESKKMPSGPKPHPLKEVLSTIKWNFSPIVAAENLQSSERNLGILVTIIDEFPNELLWRTWLENSHLNSSSVNKSNVRMWFHAKYPEKVRSPWVRERLIRSAHFKPEWGSIEITKAMAHMLHEALFDAPHINKFCFASESCIPIRSLSDTLHMLYSTGAEGSDTASGDFNSSWLNYSHIPNNGYAKQLQHDPLSRALPSGCVYKASQWVMLSRVHALAVIDLMQRVGSAQTSQLKNTSSSENSSTGTRKISDDISAIDNTAQVLPVLSNALFSAFQLVGKASDEMFFPSCLAVVGAIEPSPVEGDDSTPVAVTTDNATVGANDRTAATTTATGNACYVKKQQITYCDWTDNAKSPQEYFSFPTALVTALTQYKTYTSSTSKKKQLESLHIHPEQQHACFLRKIKFSMEYGRNELNEAQTKFLTDWLTFVVPNPAPETTTVYMQYAQALYSTIASYPTPVRVIHKRPLEFEEPSNTRDTSYNNRHDNRHDDTSMDKPDRYDSNYDRRPSSYDGRNPYSHYDDRDGNNQYRGGKRTDSGSYQNYSYDRNRSSGYHDNDSNKSGRFY